MAWEKREKLLFDVCRNASNQTIAERDIGGRRAAGFTLLRQWISDTLHNVDEKSAFAW